MGDRRSIADINADGLDDIYVCVAATEGGVASENLLYINKGGNKFEEQAAAYGINDSGYSTQAAFFDMDQDGDLDLYVLTNGVEDFAHNNIRPRKVNGEGKTNDRLYRNDGSGKFVNIPKRLESTRKVMD